MPKSTKISPPSGLLVGNKDNHLLTLVVTYFPTNSL